jgi:hypothetical protein
MISAGLLKRYCLQSPITDPGQHAALFEDLPATVGDLCQVVQGLLIHYLEGDLYGIEIPSERKAEIDTRRVSAMLERIVELDPRPLMVERPPARRLVGCCRDFAVLLCSTLRARDVPARVRFGYATYFEPDFACDHVLCEYQDGARWRLADAQMDELHCNLNALPFSTLDVPRDRFLLAGDAWLRCRRGEIDPERIGVNEEIRGMWHVQSYLVHDIAALNGMELLCWDCWGLADVAPGDLARGEELEMLDRLAAMTVAADDDLAELHELYNSYPGLKVGGVLNSYSPQGVYQTTPYVGSPRSEIDQTPSPALPFLARSVTPT